MLGGGNGVNNYKITYPASAASHEKFAISPPKMEFVRLDEGKFYNSLRVLGEGAGTLGPPWIRAYREDLQ